jgi:hypothetical protein
MVLVPKPAQIAPGHMATVVKAKTNRLNPVMRV